MWNTLCPLRRRLVQSQTLVVLVPTDGSTRDDWGWDVNQFGGYSPWLADALNIEGWGGSSSYFNELLDKGDNGANTDGVAWFTLNFKGPSRPVPMALLDESDKAKLQEGTPVIKQILDRQKKFYSILIDGKVDEVDDGGGRIDGWDKCLELKARPMGMVISGSDAWAASNTFAFSTCIEFPTNAGIVGATLLAIQRWGREMDDGEWKLKLHQAIPWSTGSRAGGTLRCDCRGCVALARSSDKRTFGGIIR
ncbi:LOW QUALITY PROTEIN: hypothetical protein ACHAXA_008522 [Cyclostephanos tholiformis]|uniref:Uncharacterized protein n=1 Tax=Cyclostephanos tholiformis TaxID=382380 RepID=A0ABD3RRA0_9STRA